MSGSTVDLPGTRSFSPRVLTPPTFTSRDSISTVAGSKAVSSLQVFVSALRFFDSRLSVRPQQSSLQDRSFAWFRHGRQRIQDVQVSWEHYSPEYDCIWRKGTQITLFSFSQVC